MRKAIALILVLAMALTFCACGKDSSQPPTTPAATPTPEAANTPAPQESETPADEPDTAPESTPEAGSAENYREESVTSSGTPIVLEYDGETGELVKTEFYSDDGTIESIQYFENEETAKQVDYRPDGQIDCEYYFENDEVTQIVFYNYDADGNLIDTTTEDMSWQGGDEGPGYNDVLIEKNGDGSYIVTEYDASGMPVYSTYYDANDVLISETIFDNGMAVLINYYENNELVRYDQYAYDGYELVWSGSYALTADGYFAMEYEQYYSNGQPVSNGHPLINDQPSGNDQPAEPQPVEPQPAEPQVGNLPELSEYEYANMSPDEVEAAFAAHGFRVNRNDGEYVSVTGFANGEAPRATITMSAYGEFLPWYIFTHEVDDSSAPMDIGLRGIKTHDSMRSVIQKLGIRNADAVASKLEELYEINDMDVWEDNFDQGVLEAYHEDVKTVFYTCAITGGGRDFDRVGFGIDYMADDYYFCIYFYFEDGILVDLEFM